MDLLGASRESLALRSLRKAIVGLRRLPVPDASFPRVPQAGCPDLNPKPDHGFANVRSSPGPWARIRGVRAGAGQSDQKLCN